MSAIQMTVTNASKTHASVDVTVSDGKKSRSYYLFVSATVAKYVTVVADPSNRRHLGKTFHDIGDIATHYKRDGAALLEIAVGVFKMFDVSFPVGSFAGA